MFQRTTAVNRILAMTARKKIIQGGSSASKTYSLLAILIDRAIKTPDIEITVVGATVPHLKGGAMKDFLKIMKQTNRYKGDNWNITNSKYTFSNGAVIEFVNADGDKAVGPRRDILYVNEANLINFETYTQLSMRTSKDIYLDFNPVNRFWVHDEVLTEPDAEMIILTYRDNEGIPVFVLEELLSKRKKADTSDYWKNWCKVYLDGEVGALEGVIFQNWTTIDSVPGDAKLLGYGMDFGFTNDPTTMIAVYKYNGKLILDEIIYQKGLLNSHIATMIKSVGAKNGPIYADSSEPKSIADIQGYGIGIYPVKKGANSVKEGIQLMQEYEYLITKSSLHLQEELNKYEWDKKKVNEPIEIWNHCFIGETLIATSKGQKRIDQITDKDYVLTSNGYKRVLKRFNNGVQQVNKYSIQFDTFSVSLCSTKEHKIKTLNTWTKISELKSDQQLFSFNYSTRKNINYTQKKSIFQEVEKDYTLASGSTTTERFKKDFMFIIKTGILGIMQLITSNLSKLANICRNTERKDLKQTKFGLMTSIPKGLRKQKNGTNQQMELNGTKNTEKNVGLEENIKNLFVSNAEKNIKQDTQAFQNSAIITAKLLHLEIGEDQSRLTYDLMIEDCHEYFANGILVHNCIDAARYLVWMQLGSRGASNPVSSFTMNY